MVKTAIPMPMKEIEAFCLRWGIVRFEVFGSVLREDFHAGSDVDVLVTFSPSAEPKYGVPEILVEELAKTFGRRVDVVRRNAIANPYRRAEICNTAETIYATTRAA